MRIGTKIGIALATAALCGMAVADFVAYRSAKSAIELGVIQRLDAVGVAYSSEIREAFKEIEEQVVAAASQAEVLEALSDFSAAYETALPANGLTENQVGAVIRFYEEVFLPALNAGEVVEDWFPSTQHAVALQYLYLASNPWPLGMKDSFLFAEDGSPYSAAHRRHHPAFSSMRKLLGLYDILLADTAGTLVYTVVKETDFGTNLFSGPYRFSPLADVVTESPGVLKWSVMKPYVPSHGDSVIHIAAPVYDGGGVFAGSLIFQIDADRVIGKTSSNFGNTGFVTISSGSDGIPFGLTDVPSIALESGDIAGYGRDATGAGLIGTSRMLVLQSDSVWVTTVMGQEEALAPLSLQRRSNITVALLAVPVLLVAGLLFAGRLTRSVSQLADFAEAFAFADSAGSPRTSGGDEVKRLNAGFQSIMDRLAKYTVSWKYLDDIFASMAEGVMVVNRPQGSTALIVVRVNAAMEKMLGAEERKIAGSKVDDWFRSEARIDTSDWRSAGKGTIVRKEETVMLTVGGEDLPVAISVAALSEENSEGTSYVFVVQDIGVRKLADAALRRAAAIVRASSNPIIVLDENGSIVEVNPAFEASTGIAGNAIFGRRPDFFALNENQLNEMLRQSALGVPWRGEVGLVLEGDTRTVMMVSTSATFDEGGEVESYILVMSDITGIKERETRFAELAKTDSLTGIANRKDFLDTLNEAVANARAKERLLAVLYIDLDGFKEINDKLGHAAGDAILVEVTERLRDAVRSTDLLARLGGDEFAVLLPNLRIESGVNSVAANVVESLQKPFDYEGEIVTVHCSVGCAVFPTDARKAEDLLKGADKAMYEAKRSGKNTFRRSDGIRNSG